ncbi:tetratricopeptide repeat protein [Algibacillus agarilyticus]|uniref:tetratricopeptide repeat protein n=1 Tax=Algibacillus agarilyticus TaxID=2234133 RepID=UPI000DD02B02|nr:sel1 repeat family protein [Algibacillus agarilyticus]
MTSIKSHDTEIEPTLDLENELTTLDDLKDLPAFELDEEDEIDLAIEDLDNIEQVKTGDEIEIPDDYEFIMDEDESPNINAIAHQLSPITETLDTLNTSIGLLLATLDDFKPVNNTNMEHQENEIKQFLDGVQFAKNNEYLLAAKCFRKSALNGHNKAMLYLGLMYSKGQGLPQSPFYGYVWLKLASLWQCKEAKPALDNLQRLLTTQEIFVANKMAAEKQEIIFDNC